MAYTGYLMSYSSALPASSIMALSPTSPFESTSLMLHRHKLAFHFASTSFMPASFVRGVAVSAGVVHAVGVCESGGRAAWPKVHLHLVPRHGLHRRRVSVRPVGLPIHGLHWRRR